MNGWIGLGTDIIEVERIQKAIERQGETFLCRLFTPSEQAYCNRFQYAARHYAGRFAAKEAILKAAGTGLHDPSTLKAVNIELSDAISWRDIEITNKPLGQPQVQLSGALAQYLGSVVIHLSISHCQAYATATAVILRADSPAAS